jgi:hypothetical protein
MYMIVIYWYIISKNNSIAFVGGGKCFLYTEDFLNLFDVFHVHKHATYWVSILSVFVELATSMEHI